MTNSFQSFGRPLRAVPSSVVIGVLAVALIGFADASYLTIEHYENAIPPCSIGACESVLTSAYSTVAGIPVSLVGAIYYLLVMLGAFAYLEGKSRGSGEKPFRYGLMLTLAGFAASLWFFILQAFVLHAFCLYCLGSAATSTVLFILTMWIFAKYRTVDTLPR